MKPTARLKDVAARAGVSPTAVSRYLNGSLVLPAATVQRIEAAVAHYDYRPNAHARSLSRGRSDTIALVLPEIGNPFFAELAAAAERAAAAAGLGIMLFATDNRLERELEYLSRLGRSDVDALLFVTNHSDADGRLAEAISRAKQVVLLDEDVPGASVPRVFADNVAGGRLAAQAFLGAGHRAVAYVGGPCDLMSARERGEGFRSVLAEAGVAAEAVAVLYGGYTVEHGRQAAAHLLAAQTPPTAVFAASDQILLGLLEVFHARGVRVPAEVSLITFDDVAPLAFFAPAISAIRQSIGGMGAAGVERLVAMIGEMPDAAAVAALRLPVEFVARASVAPPPAPPKKPRTGPHRSKT
jgi:LacI family transcriptional regulator